ncbi:CzcE family metal-binding protein [Janthinobacterium agaricidamnosum]|uniref:CzcE family metal-binding protein n=1 Tax=Janthinobacterium agaricidamnosum NBRC 102515 = DSM 9628 TaxID=1349767 RepID=W0V7R2_9BURK|nr:CzcE family metal-binding protein [Janthinobacterium agaricidamnosum]CDG83640.1 hypothetical protein GJA_3014 [Janthinobacterium agaricidamnosum NBRC 102515 = DSM 9628]
MFTFKNFAGAAAIAILSSTMLLPAAQAYVPNGTAADFGSLVAPDTPAREITIDANTKSVNVTDGETVKFNVNGKSFVWRFDTYHDAFNVKLSLLAPNSINVDGVTAYISSNSLYRG